MKQISANHRARRRVWAAGFAAIAVLSVAACGSTVRNAHELLSQQAQGGFDGSVGTTPSGSGPSTSAGGNSSGGTVTGSGQGSQSGGGSIPIPSTGDGQTTSGGANGSGKTSGSGSNKGGHHSGKSGRSHNKVPTGPAKLSPVEIGLIYSPDVGSFAKLFGATADVGNLQTDANSVISYINKHGGLDGHVLSPVYYSLSLTSTQPYSTTMAAICSSWTQDHHVAAGIAVGFSIPNDLAECLSAHHIPYLSGGNYLHDSTDYANIPYLVSPYEAGTNEVMPALIRELLARHWLTSKSRVGVLLGSNEGAAVRAYDNDIVPLLKGKVASVTSYGIDFPPTTTAAVASSQTIANDQLHARANGVTNMLFLAPGAEGSFIDDAYQQHWFPKYAITSYDTPWAATQGKIKESNATLATAIGIGWQPTMDVGTYGSNIFTNATTRTCKAILSPTGQLTTNVREFAGYQYCDGLLSVQAATDASGASTISGNSVLAGYNALGSSHPDAMTFVERLTAQHHNGASAFRPLAYSVGCHCFRYTGGLSNF